MNKDSHGRQYISHSKIVSYWMDKYVTADGDIVDECNASADDEVVVIDLGEPECWCCRKPINSIFGMKTYEDTLAQNPLKIWNSQCVRKELQRCHIIPHSLGGSDTDPGNYFLLCESCHKDSPDTANPKNFLRWFYKNRKRAWIGGWDGTRLLAEITEECKRQGKDPSTFNLSDMPKAVAQGNQISLSTFVYSFVDACKSKEGEFT